MSLREYVYNLITTDSVLNDLGITADSTFLSHTVDTPQIRPLCILRWGSHSPGITTSQQGVGISRFPIGQGLLTIWVHEDRNVGDFARIDQSLKRLRDVLTNVEGVNVGAGDEWIHTIVWEGDSDDLDDDDMRTITRNAQFRLTGSAI